MKLVATRYEELNEILKELHVLKMFNDMTDSQKHLHEEFEKKMEMFKEQAGNKNILLMTKKTDKAVESLKFNEKGVLFDYEYDFFDSLTDASDFCDNSLNDDQCLQTFVTPLFICV